MSGDSQKFEIRYSVWICTVLAIIAFIMGVILIPALLLLVYSVAMDISAGLIPWVLMFSTIFSMMIIAFFFDMAIRLFNAVRDDQIMAEFSPSGVKRTYRGEDQSWSWDQISGAKTAPDIFTITILGGPDPKSRGKFAWPRWQKNEFKIATTLSNQRMKHVVSAYERFKSPA